MSAKRLADVSAPSPSLEDLVQVRIMRLSELIARMATRTFEARFGLRNTDLRILNLLDGTPGVSVSEIGRRAHVDKAWISRSLRHLTDRGLVVKRADGKDSRLSIISLTDAGEQLVAEVRPIAATSEAMLLEGVDRTRFLANLDRLMANAETIYQNWNKSTGSTP